MPHIVEMPAHVADLIAAGEVVERPASVVKELVENAIDAGATAVAVELRRGGMGMIRVSDNGCGIAPEELPTAFLRHATSKLRRAEDLGKIGTLGFRGEALAAIASVSRVEIRTRQRGADSAALLRLEGGVPGGVEDAGAPEGTTITVSDLFYNTPARLKFMKKDSAETAAVAGLMQHLALSRPDISFRFTKDGTESLHTPGDGKAESAVYAALGRDFARTLLAVEGRGGDTEIRGFVTQPASGRGSRAMQVFFVNGRFIKSQLLTAALEEGYRNQLMKGKFPGCVLFVTLPVTEVDVNVHPAKTAVKFSREKEVFDAVYHTVLDSLEARGGAVAAQKIPQGTPEPRRDFYQTMDARTFREQASQDPAKGGVSYGGAAQRQGAQDPAGGGVSYGSAPQRQGAQDPAKGGLSYGSVPQRQGDQDPAKGGVSYGSVTQRQDAQDLAGGGVPYGGAAQRQGAQDPAKGGVSYGSVTQRQGAQEPAKGGLSYGSVPQRQGDQDSAKGGVSYRSMPQRQGATDPARPGSRPSSGEGWVAQELKPYDRGIPPRDPGAEKGPESPTGDGPRKPFVPAIPPGRSFRRILESPLPEAGENRSSGSLACEVPGASGNRAVLVEEAPPEQQEIQPRGESPWRIAGEVFRTYIVCESEEGCLWLIDKHAAHERINFDRLKAGTEPVVSQALLVPQAVELGREDAALLLGNLELLERFGFACEDFGDGTVLVREVPADIDAEDAASTLEEFAENLRRGRSLDERRENLLHTMACKAAIKGGWDSDPAELRALVDRVQSGEVRFCPHGRPVAVKLSKHEIEKMFGRA